MASDRLLHKDTRSVYSTNLSSSQIWEVLNTLLFEALAQSVANASIGFEIGLSCLAITSSAKRKLSGLEPDEFLQVCFTEIAVATIVNTPDAKLHLLKEIQAKGLERNILYEYAQRCLVHPPYIPFIDSVKHAKHIELQLQLYDTFRQDVVDRFKSLTEFSAKRNYHSKNTAGLAAEESEHYHVFVLSLMRAIDKFVPWRGTLASYILAWFENAKGASQYMVYDDEVFGLTRAIRKQVHDGKADIRNKVIPLSDRENAIPDESLEISIDLIMRMAKLPNATLLFYANAIPYYPRRRYSD